MKNGAIPSSTRERLLATAEKLFAERGYDGVGLRALAEEAEANLNAATYHFGTKKVLYVEASLHHLRPINEERGRLLDRLEAEFAGAVTPIDRILAAALRPPMVEAHKNPYFFSLMARNLFMPPIFMEGLMELEMQPFLRRFARAIHRSHPALTPSLIKAKMRLCGGALIVSAGAHLPTGSSLLGGMSAKQLDAHIAQIVRFCAAGFLA